jgi:hypothetical protein
VVCPDFEPAGFPDGFQAILPTPPPKPASLKSYTFYRGDARSPDKMKEGFQAWVPLSADQAHALLRRIAATTRTSGVITSGGHDVGDDAEALSGQTTPSPLAVYTCLFNEDEDLMAPGLLSLTGACIAVCGYRLTPLFRRGLSDRGQVPVLLA